MTTERTLPAEEDRVTQLKAPEKLLNGPYGEIQASE